LNAPTNVTWHGCRQGEGRRRLLEHRRLYMDNDRPWSVVPYVADLLDAGIPVLVYNGDRDMTTNVRSGNARCCVHAALYQSDVNRCAWIGDCVDMAIEKMGIYQP
jgi:hypothetical protein